MKSSQYQIVTSETQGCCSTEPRERPPCDVTGSVSMLSALGRAQTLQLAQQPLSKNMHTLEAVMKKKQSYNSRSGAAGSGRWVWY